MTRRELPAWPGPSILLARVDRLLPGRVLAGDPEERMRQRLLVSFGLLLLVFSLPWFALLHLHDPVVRLPRTIALCCFLLVAAAPLWLRVLSTRAASWVTVGLIHLAVLPTIALNGGLEGPVVFALTCLPVLAAVLLGPVAGWVDGVLVVLFGLGLELASGTGGVPWVAPVETWPFVRLMALSIGLSVMLLALSSYLELARAQARELRELAFRDRLTGLFNRHYVDEHFPGSQSKEAPGKASFDLAPARDFAVVLVDLDSFKAINDRWGHSVGDRVLEAVGRTIPEATRPGDVVARWAGEEFLLLLPGVDATQLEKICRRILSSIRRLRIRLDDGQEVSVTASLGFTRVPGPSSDLWDLALRLAGMALRQAKQGGRNRGTGYLFGLSSAPETVLEAISDLPRAVASGVLVQRPVHAVEVLPWEVPEPAAAAAAGISSSPP